jgi:predicted Fe-Mo cluster-binding NifX family protein
MKVVVPVEGDNLQIVSRTGRAPYYAIYEVENGNYKLIELRENLHAREHAHDDDETGFHNEEYSEAEVRHHRNQLKNIGDTDCIIVRGLGPNMKGALEREGIKIIRAGRKDGTNANDLVKKFFVD